jgi:hypothetical protein
LYPYGKITNGLPLGVVVVDVWRTITGWIVVVILRYVLGIVYV